MTLQGDKQNTKCRRTKADLLLAVAQFSRLSLHRAQGLPSMAPSWGLPQQLAEAETGGRVLVVGVGGIGCELLRNLMLTGFSYIDLIDLYTNY